MDTVFFTDLDGTLIHSASRKRGGDITVEYKDGAEISCVSELRAGLLGRLKNVVPVTTRSMEQYLRIQFPNGFSPKYAITDNGGNLLINGAPDPEWAEWARGITASCKEELDRCREILESDPDRSFEIRMVDGLFLFTKSGCPERTPERLGGRKNTDCFHTGAKVYVIPKGLNKGAGAERLLERFTEQGFHGKVICAGDSAMDIPLLNIADIALFPDDIGAEQVKSKVKLTCGRACFCDFAAEKAAQIQEALQNR